MKGAIIGDIVGSTYEHAPVKSENFELFPAGSRITDDSVLTTATAYALIQNIPYTESYRLWGRKYPNAGYGGLFHEWLGNDSPTPYNSWGNGGAMRVSPIAWAFDSLKKVEEEAENSASVTHNHPEGIKGAKAVASAIFMARMSKSKQEIKAYVMERYNYNLGIDYDYVQTRHQFDVSAQGSVPQAIIAFLESKDYEDALRKAVALGGDSDTQARIAGGIAQAFYKTIPWKLMVRAHAIIPKDVMDVIVHFNKKFNVGYLGTGALSNKINDKNKILY